MATLATTEGLIPNWFPPNRENYERILFIWQLFPLLASLQWLISWYGMGKTSVSSRLNIPGRIAWFTMEIPGFLTLLYHMRSLSTQLHKNDPSYDGLPYQNKVLAALFVLHYAYRAVLYPFLQPSMSPIHVAVWGLGVYFQLSNGLCLGSWLGAYGPTTQEEWSWTGARWSPAQFAIGLAVFYLGLAGNYYHDEELREIRRRAGRRAAAEAAKDASKNGGKSVTEKKKRDIAAKYYELPSAGMFKIVLYPHYFLEWVEWFGFWMAAGWGSVPARCFVVNEVFAMLPRAVRGRKWYAEKFGEEKVRNRWAVIPGMI